MKVTEENFISKMIERDEEAMQYVIKEYGWIIKTVIKKHLYQLSQYEEECTNDILLAVWNHISRFDESKNTFKNWIAGVSKFTALNYVRKYKKELETAPIDDMIIVDHKTPDQYMNEEEKSIENDFRQILSCLKEKDQELFIKLYIKNQSIDEISRETGIKRDVIYNRMSRAKNKIRNNYKSKGGI